MYETIDKNSTERIFSSRIAMVNAIYGATIQAIEEAIAIIESGTDAHAAEHRTKALSFINLIESGLQPTGELPDRIRQLCHYAQQCVLTYDVAKLRSAAKVLRNLYEGFQGIQSEAVRLERTGQIPPLQTTSVDVFV